MNVQDPEALVQCPYDKVHMIRRKRLPYHLQKCRKNYGGRAFKVCPFNARHEVPEPEYQHHLINCPNKSLVERDMVHIKRLQEDNSYRERYEFGFGASMANNGTNCSNGGVDWPRDQENQNDLIESFDRAVTFDEDAISATFSHRQQQQAELNVQEHRQLLLYEERRTTDDQADTSDYGSDGQVDGSRTADNPKTEPVTLQMIRTFGRGSQIDYGMGGEGRMVLVGGRGEGSGDPGWNGDGSDYGGNGVGRVGDRNANFGAPFPKSLGRGTMISGRPFMSTKHEVKPNSCQDWDENIAEQRVSPALFGRRQYEQFEDSPYDQEPPQTACQTEDEEFPALDAQRGRTRTRAQQRQDHQIQQQQQLQQQQFHDDSPWEPEVRQHSDANFPEFQKGFTPRYSSTFGADRPLSKQAQIQLAQQQQQQLRQNNGYSNRGPAVNWKKARRGRGAGRGYSKMLEEQQ